MEFLSEEVFDFSSGQMTQAKAKALKESMNSEFQQIFQLCLFIMVIKKIIKYLNKKFLIKLFKANSQNISLITVTLETLLRFLNWIPLGYIFETELVLTLISTFFVMPQFRNITLKCLTEIGK